MTNDKRQKKEDKRHKKTAGQNQKKADKLQMTNESRKQKNFLSLFRGTCDEKSFLFIDGTKDFLPTRREGIFRD